MSQVFVFVLFFNQLLELVDCSPLDITVSAIMQRIYVVSKIID